MTSGTSGKDKRVELGDLATMKKAGQPITMVTAYDAPTARLVDQAGVDTILVGDSLSNVVLGHEDTVPVTLDDMIHHIKAVRRGTKRVFVIGDMPFGSYNGSTDQAVANATRILKEGQVAAVKLEGGGPMVDKVRAIVEAGVPVCGHLGLTPQTASMQGGYRVQGRSAKAARQMVEDAIALQKAGAFMLVLEMVPTRLAEFISAKLQIPVIGIGAGNGCDGQVLVIHDLLGVDPNFHPKFLKRYADLGQVIHKAVGEYCTEVRARKFPGEEHSFHMPDEIWAALQKELGVDGED